VLHLAVLRLISIRIHVAIFPGSQNSRAASFFFLFLFLFFFFGSNWEGSWLFIAN
jgi:hypothetical protein